MEKVIISICEDEEIVVKEVLRVSNQIHSVIVKKLKHRYLDFDIETLFQNIQTILCRWSGYCPVGIPKSQQIKKAYQQFFIELFDFLLICKNELPDCELKSFSEEALYKGKIYRYLGYGGSAYGKDINKKIDPIYEEIYVSWSKNECNSYFEEKLKGVMTHLTCEIKNDHYGIDLDVFEASRPNEAEVVYPTREKEILKVQYKI